MEPGAIHAVRDHDDAMRRGPWTGGTPPSDGRRSRLVIPDEDQPDGETRRVFSWAVRMPLKSVTISHRATPAAKSACSMPGFRVLQAGSLDGIAPIWCDRFVTEKRRETAQNKAKQRASEQVWALLEPASNSLRVSVFRLVGPQGIEPRSAVPETAVLSVELWTRQGRSKAERRRSKVSGTARAGGNVDSKLAGCKNQDSRRSKAQGRKS